MPLLLSLNIASHVMLICHKYIDFVNQTICQLCFKGGHPLLEYFYFYVHKAENKRQTKQKMSNQILNKRREDTATCNNAKDAVR